MKPDAADQQASSPSGSPSGSLSGSPSGSPGTQEPNPAGDRSDNKRISVNQSSNNQLGNNQSGNNQSGNNKPNKQLNRTKIISHQATQFPDLRDLLLTKKEEEVFIRCKRYPFLFFTLPVCFAYVATFKYQALRTLKPVKSSKLFFRTALVYLATDVIIDYCYCLPELCKQCPDFEPRLQRFAWKLAQYWRSKSDK